MLLLLPFHCKLSFQFTAKNIQHSVLVKKKLSSLSRFLFTRIGLAHSTARQNQHTIFFSLEPLRAEFHRKCAILMFSSRQANQTHNTVSLKFINKISKHRQLGGTLTTTETDKPRNQAHGRGTIGFNISSKAVVLHHLADHVTLSRPAPKRGLAARVR